MYLTQHTEGFTCSFPFSLIQNPEEINSFIDGTEVITSERSVSKTFLSRCKCRQNTSHVTMTYFNQQCRFYRVVLNVRAAADEVALVIY